MSWLKNFYKSTGFDVKQTYYLEAIAKLLQI